MFRKSSLEARKSSDYSAQIPSCSEHTVFRSVFACQTIPHATDFSNSICKEKQTWPNVRTIDMISSSLQHSFDKILYTFHPKKLASTKLKRILNLRCKYTLSDQSKWNNDARELGNLHTSSICFFCCLLSTIFSCTIIPLSSWDEQNVMKGKYCITCLHILSTDQSQTHRN